ncbi:MAG: glycosyltransferase family 9 protein [Nitrospinae bacterium]|nr:glycosyltransferase family 9 protein [Nitrospinota bacterium]MBF0634799.1 glycosyltransferase family 9 protein [Nitrospinota bacterium]
MSGSILKKDASVLIVKPSSMGDIIHAFPVAAAIKKTRPDVTVDWIAADGFTELVRLSPHVDHVIPFLRKQWGGAWWKPSTIRSVAGFLFDGVGGRRYDAVLDLHALFRSGLITAFAKAPVKIGFSDARELAPVFYNTKITPPPGAHSVDKLMSALGGLDIAVGGPPSFDITIPGEARSWAAKITPESPFVAINPNARWATKRWPVANFAVLSKEIYRRSGALTVIIGGPEDMERGEELARLIGPPATNLTGAGGFARLAAVLERALLTITNDSGPMHLSAAVGTPVIALFGPTDPALVGPYGKGHTTLRAKVDCSPCREKTNCSRAIECMTKITVEEALGAWESASKNRENSAKKWTPRFSGR